MVAVVGLGPIGAGAGASLVRAGFDVVGVDLDPARASAWAERTGAEAVVSATDVDWDRVDLAVAAVRLGEHLDGVFATLPARAARPLPVLVLSTLAVSAARRLAKVEHVRVVECPVSGGEWAADDGSLTTFVHAPAGPTDLETSVLDAIGSRRFDFDAYGEPALAKLANNTLGAYNAVATSAMLRLASDHGLDPSRFLDIVNTSSGHSWMSEHFHTFPDDLLFKDVALLREDVPQLPALDLQDLEARRAEIHSARRSGGRRAQVAQRQSHSAGP